MDPRDQMDTIVPLLNDLARSIDDEQLDAPTPCSAFAVRDVLGHMVTGGTMFAAAFRGDAPPEPPELNDDVATKFTEVMKELQASVRSPGALERTIHAPFGDVPGDVFARFVALDGVVHGWDIATATGQAYDPPADLLDAVGAFARQAIPPEMRDGETFAAEVDPPAGASPLLQLVAFTGRKV